MRLLNFDEFRNDVPGGSRSLLIEQADEKAAGTMVYLLFNTGIMNESDFFEACRSGKREEVMRLYQVEPALVNAVDAKGYTPLIIAAYNNQPELTAFLLEQGADPDAQDAAGNTALMGVSFKGYTDIARQLVEAGADVNVRNSSGAPALTFAATFGHLRIAELLLQRGADITLADARGKTPFDHARIQENEAMMDLIERFYRP